MFTKRVIIEAGDLGPELCLEDIGQICLSDFQLYDSTEIKRRVKKLYIDGLEPVHRAIEMEEGDIQKIVYFGRIPHEKSEIEAFKKDLNRKYMEYGLRIPEG